MAGISICTLNTKYARCTKYTERHMTDESGIAKYNNSMPYYIGRTLEGNATYLVCQNEAYDCIYREVFHFPVSSKPKENKSDSIVLTSNL